MPVKRAYTTGEVAQICKVSQQTIIRCFDDGILEGFRVPRSKMRRIPLDSLIDFMRREGIPTDALEIGLQKILIAIDEPVFVKQFGAVLSSTGNFSVRSVSNAFDAGVMIGENRPDLIVLDAAFSGLTGKDICSKEMCSRIRNHPDLNKILIICIGENLRKGKITELREAGADDFLPKPVDIATLTDRINRMLGIKDRKK